MLAKMHMRDLQRGSWVTARRHRVAEPDYGRVTEVDLNAGTVTVLWISSATEETHNIVPKKEGDDPRTNSLTMSSEDAVREYVRSATNEANARVTEASRILAQAEASRDELLCKISAVFG